MKKFIFLFIVFASSAFANDHQIMLLKKDGVIAFAKTDQLIPVHKDAIEKLLDYYEKNKPPCSKVKIFFSLDENNPEKLEYNVSYEYAKKG